MTSNFMLASNGWMQRWLYEVLVYDIDHSLQLNGCSRSKDDNMSFLLNVGGLDSGVLLAVIELHESGKLASNPVNQS